MDSSRKETIADLRKRLAGGESLEIAGYRLCGDLAVGLEALALTGMPPTDVDRIGWIDAVPQRDRPLLPSSQRVIDTWSAHGAAIVCAVVICDQFWATQEIAQCPAIVAEAMRFLIG
jgi:hypothetical protein